MALLTVLNAAVSVAVVTREPRVAQSPYVPQNDGMEGERNERSTPRQFVLPATPAVAEIDEERRERSPEAVEMGCLVTLAQREKLVYLGESAGSAANKAAVFEYQRDNELPANGILNVATRAALECD